MKLFQIKKRLLSRVQSAPLTTPRNCIFGVRSVFLRPRIDTSRRKASSGVNTFFRFLENEGNSLVSCLLDLLATRNYKWYRGSFRKELLDRLDKSVQHCLALILAQLLTNAYFGQSNTWTFSSCC
jgi:hypothetical protein